VIEMILGLLFNPVYHTTLPNPQAQIERITPLKLLQRNHKVTQGFVCWYPFEVKCIDDKCGDDKSYWEVSVNGDTRHYNANSRLKKSDVVRWTFVKENKK